MNNDILNYTIVGFEFEFYSKKGIEYAKKTLSSALSKKILVFEEVHGDYQPTDEVYKLEKDNSGGAEMLELITGPMSYGESRLILIKTLNCFKDDENFYTSDRSSVQFNVSFDTKYTGKDFLTHLNVLKFILELDEDKILESFPKRKDSVYSKSIKFILPLNKFYIDNIKPSDISPRNFILPSDKYYGVNFSKLVKGYLEFRYLGGKDYEDKLKETQDVIDYCVTTLYESLRSSGYTSRNLEEIHRILLKHKKVIDSYRSYSDFKRNYPKIKLSIDLRFNDVVTDVYFDKFRSDLFDILSLSSMKTGYINYDSDKSRLQLKETTLSTCFNLSNVDIIESTINGIVKDCNIFDCTIINSNVDDCKIHGSSTISNSKVRAGYIGRFVEVKNSYLFGKNLIFNGKFISGIFREGKISSSADIQNDVKVIDFKKI